MTNTPHIYSDDQHEALEAFDRALDACLDAGVRTACMHRVIDNRLTWLRTDFRPTFRPWGWKTIAGAPYSPHHDVTNGTPEAAVEIFRPWRVVRRFASTALRTFKLRSSTAIDAGFERVELHRVVDAGYWSHMGWLYERAGDHAWKANVAPSQHRRVGPSGPPALVMAVEHA
ncbi:MAG: hypothetical protein KC468_35795 [Myxococcales bacterium]|nr:hypothetical protein [Myxococcales bacterium]